MNTSQPDSPAIGDRITFRAATRYSDRRTTRVVNGFYMGQPTVRFGGHLNFIVRHHEIVVIGARVVSAA